MAEDQFFGQTRLGEEWIVSLKNVHKTYLLGVEGVAALRGVNASIKRGEFVCIYGTSGGGKTTLLNIIGAIDQPTKGEMMVCGQRITPDTSDEVLSKLRREHMAFVFQTFNLLSAYTAQENVEMPMTLHGGYTKEERRKRAQKLLKQVGMGARMDHKPAQLSGGEQQRVTIARAISNQPDLLLLDEPTGDLDTVNTLIVLKLLLDLNQIHGITLVMVTHDVALKSHADRVIWMRDGRVQRIEVVPEKTRADAHARLAKDLAEIQVAKGKPVGPPVSEERDPSFYTLLRDFGGDVSESDENEDEEEEEDNGQAEDNGHKKKKKKKSKKRSRKEEE